MFLHNASLHNYDLKYVFSDRVALSKMKHYVQRDLTALWDLTTTSSKFPMLITISSWDHTLTYRVQHMNSLDLGLDCAPIFGEEDYYRSSLQRRHNERDGVSNRRRLDCLHNRMFRRRSLTFVRGIDRWPVNSSHKGPVMRKIWWRHHVSLISLWREFLILRKYLQGSLKHLNIWAAGTPVKYESDIPQVTLGLTMLKNWFSTPHPDLLIVNKYCPQYVQI